MYCVTWHTSTCISYCLFILFLSAWVESSAQPVIAHTSAYVSIRQHTSALPIRQHTSAYVSIRQHTSAYVVSGSSSRKAARHCPFRAISNTSAYVSIRQHTSAYAFLSAWVESSAQPVIAHLGPYQTRALKEAVGYIHTYGK
jgi:hypothetical protein